MCYVLHTHALQSINDAANAFDLHYYKHTGPCKYGTLHSTFELIDASYIIEAHTIHDYNVDGHIRCDGIRLTTILNIDSFAFVAIADVDIQLTDLQASIKIFLRSAFDVRLYAKCGCGICDLHSMCVVCVRVCIHIIYIYIHTCDI